ncbi:MAG: DUF3419 family protein [Myxococcota bacterium]
MLRDDTFQRVFARTYAYNILFEDAEVDEQHLGLNHDSRVLSITGAGCGVAGMISAQPHSVDAVDINKHHLAITALKCAAAQHMKHYDDFYDLLGRGWSHDPRHQIEPLTHYMPAWAASYWRRQHKRFRKSWYQTGLTARMLSAVRKRAGIGVSWARRMCALPDKERLELFYETISRVDTPVTRLVLQSPLQLVALGINFQQRDRLLETERTSMSDYFITHLARVIQHPDLWNNWFFWYAAAGSFNHESDDCAPPYLRKSRWEKSIEAPTRVHYHNGNLFDRMEQATAGTWSHYTLCDAIDWMPLPVQQHLFSEIRRTGRDGAIVLLRSVEETDPVEASGASSFLRKLDCSEQASKAERSRQYRQTNFYRLEA